MTSGKREWTIGTVAAGLLFAAAVIGIPLFAHFDEEPLPPDELKAAQILGKPLRLQTAAGERILLLSEQYGVHWYRGSGPGRRSFSRPVSEQVVNIDLWAFEPGNPRPLWRRRFKNNTPGVMTSVGDILIGQGDSVWLALGKPARVAADDGRLLPAAQRAGEPRRGDEVYDLRDLQARGLRTGDRWIGVLTAANHGQLTAPGSAARRPDSLGFAGDDDDYTLWTARVRDVPGAFGNDERYADFQPLGQPARLHRAGLLKLAQRGAPVTPPDPDSVVVLHRGPDIDGARLSLTRIGTADGAVVWSAADLPIARLRHLLPGAGDLVLVGDAPRPPSGATGEERSAPEQWVVFLDLASGGQGIFSLAEASLAGGPAPLE